MKGRPNIHQDKELILKAQEVFWKRGYNATSLSDLTSATGAGAGSLYNTFKGGKKELFQKALQQRRQELEAFKQTLENSDTPVSVIKKFFLEIANADGEAHQKGCIVANTIVEMTFVDAELQSEAAQILQDTERMYTMAIAKAQKKGVMTAKVPANTLGKALVTIWCGINSIRRIYPDKKLLREQIQLQLRILD
ncbi:TetR/AcrR family transcriptional regulator [Paraflavitalea pollutisoli]|uniref:TetR/AcrR family transcriptional regulator n=1 Tax=Paraflavitalea pollutisoli TaxID=3034143 RepID=UPI0023ED3F93|nr:TetR/AcrR family transcriptional regulator [Paraflavitalea sp. H1-2-19X]